MNVLILGSGGREHALGWKISTSGLLHTLHMAPAGSHKDPRFIDANVQITDGEAVAAYCRAHQIGLVVIGPEAPLVAGVSDNLRAQGIPVFGPSARGARLEGSKIYAKKFMERHGVPTADSVVCSTVAEVRAALMERGEPMVVKCDGLAAGKGVGVPDTIEEALSFAQEIFSGAFGDHPQVLLEEKLSGPEVSIFALLDGTRYTLLAPSQDHKRLRDNDLGPNTGGMGAFTPVAGFGADALQMVHDTIMKPIMSGLLADNIDYRGLLYVGLMATPKGHKVLEFNCRFGDPETQPVMVALQDDILPWLYGAAQGTLPEGEPVFKDGCALAVVLAAENYPSAPVTGLPISGLDGASRVEGVTIFHAGTTFRDGAHYVSGGRVLAVTAFGESTTVAQRKAYEAVSLISWPGMQFRKDIGNK